MRVVGILTLLPSDRGDEERLRLVVPRVHRHRDELAVGDAVLQRPRVRVVEIIVAPAVALGPEEQVLPVVHEAQRLGLDIGVEALFDDRVHFAGVGVGDADVEALHVSAQAREVDLVGGGAQPLRRRAGVGTAAPTAAATLAAVLSLLPAAKRACLFALARARGRSGDREILVLEAIGLHLRLLLRRDVEHVHLFAVDVLFAWHRVAIGLEGGAGIRQRVDDPQVLDLAFVAPQQRELLRIGRPDDRGGGDARVRVLRLRGVLLLRGLLVLLLILLLLLLLLIVLPGADVARVGVVLFTIGRQLRLDDRGIGRRLLRLGEVRRVHHVEVVVAREDDGLAVRRHSGPARTRGRRDVVLVQRHLAAGHVVFEAQRARAGRRARRRTRTGAASLLRIVVVFIDRIGVAALRWRGGDPLLDGDDVGVTGDLDLELEDRIVLRELQV